MLLTLDAHENHKLHDSRETLRRALEVSSNQIYASAYRLVPREHWGSVGARYYVGTVVRLVSEAVATGEYTSLCAWVAKNHFFADEADIAGNTLGKALILEVKRIVERICAGAVPAFSVLTGEIALGLSQLGKAVSRQHEHSWRESGKPRHDPIDVAVDSIIAALDEKDEATGEHSRAVSSWCHRIAGKMGLSDEMILRVTRGGLIHDLGKVTVPDEVLTAPRKLDEEEWKQMANHVVAGDQMIGMMPALIPLRTMVRSHHEHYTGGGGYPDRLATADIPLETRIVTVADSFNAMIGRRPYRRAKEPTVAIAELRRFRGRQFDPDVTDAMTDVMYDIIREQGQEAPAEWGWQPKAA